MKLSTITNQVQITNNDLPTNVFLTNYNNMIVLLRYLSTSTSYPTNLTSSYTSPTLSISAHTRQYVDGSTTSMPQGTVSTTTSGYVTYDSGYSITTTRPSKTMIVGYFNGTTLTPYQASNM